MLKIPIVPDHVTLPGDAVAGLQIAPEPAQVIAPVESMATEFP
jgi:hypothetical protein